MSGFRVIPLVCPDCGRQLAGLRYDKIFICMACKQGLLPEKESDWIRYPLAFARIEPPPQARLIYLPFWQIKIEANAMPVNQRQEAACRRLNTLKAVWVQAFTLIRPSYFGDIGLFYTERDEQPEKMTVFPSEFYVAGCSRTLEDAHKYTRLFVTLILDKKADVTGMDIEVWTRDAILWAMPFADHGDKIMDLITGTELPAFAVDDLEDIRRINRRP
jgi:hypothetical protein